MEYEVLNHACIRMETEGKVIYFDPFGIDGKYHDADIVFITHGHFDHYSVPDIEKVRKEGTVITVPESMGKIQYRDTLYVHPFQNLMVKGIRVETVPSYNLKKPFHKKEDGNCGYILSLEGETCYVMGDTDANPDIMDIHADYVFIPIGGKYTFDEYEAADYIRHMKPKKAVPIHLLYNDNPVKTVENFERLINNDR